MGSLVVKTIKGQEYLYWVKSQRNSKKQGGDGKTKTIWYILGKKILKSSPYIDSVKYFPCDSIKYLPYYFWNKDIKIIDFIPKYIEYLIKNILLLDSSIYKFNLDNNFKFTIRSKNNSYDFRKYQHEIKIIKSCTSHILSFEKIINDKIKLLLNYINSYNEYIKKGNEFKQISKSDNTGFYTDRMIDIYNRADNWFNIYQKELNILSKYAPESQRKKFIKDIESYIFRKIALEKMEF